MEMKQNTLSSKQDAESWAFRGQGGWKKLLCDKRSRKTLGKSKQKEPGRDWLNRATGLARRTAYSYLKMC